MSSTVTLPWRRNRCAALAALLSILGWCQSDRAAEPVVLTSKEYKPVLMSSLPDFKAEMEEKVTKKGLVHTNGLCATINYKEFKEPKIEGEVKIKLPPSSTGFRDFFEIRALWQPTRAPLAIVLLGFYEDHDDKLAHLWQAHLYEAGCHVVCFNSIFRNECNKCAGHGVAGNVVEEAKVLAKLIDGLLDYQEALGSGPIREKVTSVRLLGTSYGGTLALNLVRHERAKTWPVDRVLVLSAPIKLSTTMLTVDRFYEVDRSRFQPSLIKLMGGYTPEKNQPNEREMSLMRGGIGYDFYDTLDSLLKHNEPAYMPGLFERYRQMEEAEPQRERRKQEEDELKGRHDKELDELKAEFDSGKMLKDEYKSRKKEMKERHTVESNLKSKRLSDRSCWTYKDYVEIICAPYWRMKPEELLVQGNLDALLKGSPDFVQAVIAADDPLNKEEELAALRQQFPEPKLLVLPHGGHLGFVATQWTRALILSVFKR